MHTHSWPVSGLLRRLSTLGALRLQGLLSRLFLQGIQGLRGLLPSPPSPRLLHTFVLCLLLGASAVASANEATIRANLAERLPNLPRIDEVRPTPMRGLFEVRVNQTQIFYTDAEGSFILQGQLIDTRSRNNLTEQRVEQLSAIAFDQLPRTMVNESRSGN